MQLVKTCPIKTHKKCPIKTFININGSKNGVGFHKMSNRKTCHVYGTICPLSKNVHKKCWLLCCTIVSLKFPVDILKPVVSFKDFSDCPTPK